MPSAVNLGSWEFSSFVPTWIKIFSGSYLRIGLIKSSMSSVVATGNGFTTTLLVLERLQPRMFWMIEYPAITATGFPFLSVHCFQDQTEFLFVLFQISFLCFVFFAFSL